MPAEVLITKPASFSFGHTIRSHGWYDLAPFELDEEQGRLIYVFGGQNGYGPATAELSEDEKSIRIQIHSPDFDVKEIASSVRHILRLDDDFEAFYLKTKASGSLSWVSQRNAGRLLRSPTVFEDAVKTLCTTNCSWSLTKKMVSNLVEKLGERAADGRRAFPTPVAMAAVDEKFYRDEIRAGYRSPYFVELAQAVVGGELDPEQWLTSGLSTPELKKEIKKVKGFGDYAAENLLKLLGRYDGLALDSWLRSRFYEQHNKSRVCPDKKIERHYRSYAEWKGLAIWCDMTEKWFDEKP